MNIRRIEERDLKVLAELFVSVFNAPPWNESWTIKWAYDRLDIIFKSHRFYGYVAEKHGTAIGAIFSRLGSYKGMLELEIIENYVSGNAQRKGVGAALMSELKLQAQQDGISCFVLQTDKTTFAKEFYLKYGFEGHEENLLMSHGF